VGGYRECHCETGTRPANLSSSLMDKREISIPTLFVQATHDSVLTPDLSVGMENYLTEFTRKEVAATHWALTQKPEEVNAIIHEWLGKQGFGSRSLL
jgi:soluble epoxide hydrolase / lipid-phosphate phosphatase